MQLFCEERSLKPKSGFISRQFGLKGTQQQLTFDVVVGVIGPLACFMADPIVFRDNFSGGFALLGKYQLLAYMLSALEMVLLLVWLTFEQHLKPFSAPMGGALIGGAVFSALIGLVILPFSLLGLLMIVGLAGFTPFLTSFVYLRNGIRALRIQERNASYQGRYSIAAATAIIAFCLPYAGAAKLNNILSSAVSDLLNGDEAQAEQAMKILRPWSRLSEIQLQPIVVAVNKSANDPLRQELLRKRYFEITGRNPSFMD